MMDLNQLSFCLSVCSKCQRCEYGSTVSCCRWRRWTKRDQPSGMVVMEVDQLTGYAPIDLEDVKHQPGSVQVKRVESKEDKVVLYFDEVRPLFVLSTRHSVCLSVCLWCHMAISSFSS